MWCDPDRFFFPNRPHEYNALNIFSNIAALQKKQLSGGEKQVFANSQESCYGWKSYENKLQSIAALLQICNLLDSNN